MMGVVRTKPPHVGLEVHDLRLVGQVGVSTPKQEVGDVDRPQGHGSSDPVHGLGKDAPCNLLRGLGLDLEEAGGNDESCVDLAVVSFEGVGAEILRDHCSLNIRMEAHGFKGLKVKDIKKGINVFRMKRVQEGMIGMF